MSANPRESEYCDGAISPVPREEDPSSSSADPPERADRFVRQGEVNRGGIGRIEAALDPVLGRRVAIKVLHGELSSDEQALGKFSAEAQITGQLDHPNIVPIHDLGEDDSGPFIVMKLVKGKTLGQLINDARATTPRPDELQRFVRIVLRLCDALSFAHSRGVIHCDLKPENVMVGGHGEVYLMDWGVALLTSLRPKAAEPSEGAEYEELVRISFNDSGDSSTFRGTPAYMAPEQLFGRVNEIDERTDVFGLGAVLYEIMTGDPPNDRARLLLGARDDAPPPLPNKSPLWPHLPPELWRITSRALSPRREQRYPDVGSLAAELEQFLSGGGWFETRIFPAGASIVSEGEQGTTAYIIERGECDVFKLIDGQQTFVRRMKVGDVFGEMAVLSGAPRTASVTAVGEVVVKVITGDSLTRELDRNPWLAAFVRSLAERFRQADARLSAEGRTT